MGMGQSGPGTPGRVGAWVQAVRPKTLPVAIVPVLVGTCLAWAESDRFSVAILFAAALAALLIQAGTNLHNDAADFERGGDDPVSRIGPRRAVAEGWLSARQVKAGAAVAFASAFAAGMYLVAIGGLPILAVGVVSILAALAYSGGPRPIAYTCLGEFFVWVFFGFVAVGGTYYLQAERMITANAWLAGALIGLPAAAVLVVNNTRDVDNDRQSGRRTFPVVFGVAASRFEYSVLMLLPFPLAIWLATGFGGWGWLPLLGLPHAILLVRRFNRADSGQVFNTLLAATAKFQLGFSVLLCTGLLLGAAWGPD